MLKVYYQIPDSDNDQQNKMIGMLYENYKVRIQLACASVEKLIDKENGIVFIDRRHNPEAIELRYEGFSPELELILKFCIAQIKDKQKVKF